MDALEFFNQLRRENETRSKRDKGLSFEIFTRQYLLLSKKYQNEYDNVWLWSDFPYRDSADTGIDLVAKRVNSDEYTAIQCKFYVEDATIHKSDIDSFISCSEKYFIIDDKKHYFANRMIVTTASSWSHNVKDTVDKARIPTICIDFNDFLQDSDINWLAFQNIEDLTFKYTKKELREHQKEAISGVLSGFKECDRGKLIMACGTGKTFTSLKIAESFTNKENITTVLFLAPSISLVSQNINEWLQESSVNMASIPVCSDITVGKTGRNKDDDTLTDGLTQLSHTATTNVEEFVKRYKSIVDKFSKNIDNNLIVIFSTYQSIEVVQKGQAECGFIFDLIICDEAHRTTGATAKADIDKSSHFLKIHDDNYIKGNKRLYMTATPKMFGEAVKSKARELESELWSMDDESIFGHEFYRLGFGKAVENNLLTDYKVLILTVSENYAYKCFMEEARYRQVDNLEYLNNIENKSNNKNREEISLDDYGKIIGIWNAISKQHLIDETTYTNTYDPNPMKRAVLFTGTIRSSKSITNLINNMVKNHKVTISNNNNETNTVFDYEENGLIKLNVDHIDGSMTSSERNKLLRNLKQESEDKACKILSNARCLSEGIDVPSLDAVIFFSQKNSEIDIVQSIGRVMRKSEGKKYGYIILPVVVPDEIAPEIALDNNKEYGVVWTVLQALRAHDDRFNKIVNSLQFNKSEKDKKIEVEHISDKTVVITPEKLKLEIDFHHRLTDTIYNKIVQKCGERIYWEKWASEVTELAKFHIKTLNEIILKENANKAFNRFLEILRLNLNEDIEKDDAIKMVSQHLITKPIFEVLFSNYSFVANNPVSQAIEELLINISDEYFIKGSKKLDNFYESVKRKVDNIKTSEERQHIIKELYNKFFKIAFKEDSDKLGIVYTPIEAVDFIINAVEYALNKYFNKSLNDRDINIVDPFTGTGTFISRLLQSGIIKNDNMEYKYNNEIFANEIMLLAYYIAAINIEETYHNIMNNKEYTPFQGIVLTDTFNLYETSQSIEDIQESSFYFKENISRLQKQKETNIKVIIGNPPYSVGQKSANDNNKNTRYEKLEQAITDNYRKYTQAKATNSLYDSYVKAIRYATDRIDSSGVVCFVTNSGYIDSNAFDGFRKCIHKDFNYIYIIDLKGNIRKFDKREGENIFGNTSMTGTAIILLIKNNSNEHKIYYNSVPDNLKQKDKLDYLKNNTVASISYKEIKPDKYNDWLNKRDDSFYDYVQLGDKKSDEENYIFKTYSSGIKTNRDSWMYNFSKKELKVNIKNIINNYNMELSKYVSGAISEKEITKDETKIKWDSSLESIFKRKKYVIYNGQLIYQSLYRPFTKQYLYFQKELINTISSMPSIFPTPQHKNIVIAISDKGSSKEFLPFISNKIVDFHLLDSQTQCFPLYLYIKYDERKHPDALFRDDLDKDGYKKEYAITDYALQEYKKRYGEKVCEEYIFYYIYGILHNKEYREKYSNNLKKSLARIPFVKKKEDFFTYSQLGRDLADLHLNYEIIEPYPLKENFGGGIAILPLQIMSYIELVKWYYQKIKNSLNIINILLFIIYQRKLLNIR